MNNVVHFFVEWHLGHIDGLWSLLVQEWHEDANQDHILELLVEGQLKYFVIVLATSIKDFFLVLTYKERKSD